MPDTTGIFEGIVPGIDLMLVGGCGLSLSSPKPTLSIKGGGVMALEVSIPTIDLETSVDELEIFAPAPTAAITSNYTLGKFENEAPVPEIAAHGYVSSGSLLIEAPLPVLSLESNFTRGSLALITPKPTIAFSGYPGTVGDLALSAPKPTISFSGFSSTTGSLLISAPVPQLTIQELAALYKCIVLNTDRWLVSEYDNFNFNALAKFGDTYLAADSNGIYELTGEDDNGTDIDAELETGLDDFGAGNLKRVQGAYLALKSDGIIKFTIKGDEIEQGVSEIDSTGDVSKVRKPKINRRNKGNFLSFKVENVEGADFDLYGLELFLSMLDRRIDGI